MNKNMAPVIIVILIVMIVGVMYLMQGAMMQSRVSVEEAKFHDIQAKYWNVDKATRDSAPAGSELNQQLVEIKNYPSELLRLKLVGIGNILIGIFAMLLDIFIALMMMPTRLGKAISKSNK